MELDLSDMRRAVWTNLLAVFLSDGLTRLRTLALRAGPCTSDDLENLLSHAPSLTSLVLRGLLQVPSVSFFRQLPRLADTLTQLTVDCEYPWRLYAADLQLLLVLRQLRVLRLSGWRRNDSPIAEARAAFEQRPCNVLPHLEVFEWLKDRPY